MGTKLKQIGLSIAYMLGLYILIFIFRPIYIYSIIQGFSTRKYIDNLTMSGQGFEYLMLLIYCIVSFFWTRRTLLSNNKIGLLFWIVNWIVDFVIPPLSVLIVVLYHNYSSVPDIKNLSLVENFFLMWLLLAIKHVFFHIANGNLSFGKRINKNSSAIRSVR